MKAIEVLPKRLWQAFFFPLTKILPCNLALVSKFITYISSKKNRTSETSFFFVADGYVAFLPTLPLAEVHTTSISYNTNNNFHNLIVVVQDRIVDITCFNLNKPDRLWLRAQISCLGFLFRFQTHHGTGL